ncbi:MAG TPA: ankyrin repeat domain-containing protein [Kofleriaceae bacterium]|nr:ankyrin repeat domain-containing protein [Kofleriaceae bacterium]
MSKSLPPRPDLAWLRKRAKEVQRDLRRRRPGARLADAQLAVAREHGLPSWRALVERVRALRAAPARPPDVPEAAVAEFLRSVGVGDREAVASMLQGAPALVHAVGPHPFWGGRAQALHVAIESNRHAMVMLILRAGADVDGVNGGYMHWSPLMIAMSDRRHRARRELLRRGARVGLVEALMMGDDGAALRMLRRGRAALPAEVPNGGSLLMFARTPAAVDRLLALGASTEARDRWGATPMEAFSRLGRRGTALVRHLAAKGIAAGPEAFARIGDRRTLARLVAADPAVARAPAVIKAAADFGHRALVAWLLDRGADVNARGGGETDETSLHSAAWNGDLAMVELLLARGADPLLLDRKYDGTAAGWAETSLEVTSKASCADVAARLREAERRAGA